MKGFEIMTKLISPQCGLALGSNYAPVRRDVRQSLTGISFCGRFTGRLGHLLSRQYCMHWVNEQNTLSFSSAPRDGRNSSVAAINPTV